MRLFSRLAVLLLGLSALLAGCGDKPQPWREEYPPEAYVAVLSLSPSTTEILGTFAPAKLRGRTEACNWPLGIPPGVPVVAGVKPYLERIAALKPPADMALYDASLFRKEELSKLEQLKIKLYGFSADTIDGFVKELSALSAMLGFETQASEYVDKIIAARSAALASAPKPPLKVAIINFGYIAGKNSFYADVIRAAGGEPVGPDSNKFEKLNAEALVAMNPQVIVDVNDEAFAEFEKIATSDSERTKRQQKAIINVVRPDLLNDPRFKTLDAIKNRRIASGRPDIVLRRGSRVDIFIADLGAYLGAQSN